MDTITWLHLSDFHFRTTQQHTWDENIVLRALLDDVADQVRSDALRPDFVVVTGDIAFSGQPAEYRLAQAFLDDLLSIVGIGQDRLFLVPGNHDVDRSRVPALARLGVGGLTDRHVTKEVLGDARNLDSLFAGFDPFVTFANDYLAGHLQLARDRYYYCRVLDVGRQRVALLGLNSAWRPAAIESADDRVLLGEWQTHAVLKEAKRAQATVTVALLHHPLDLLCEFDREDSGDVLVSQCDYILHGHRHRTSADRLSNPDGEAVVLACGACYEARERANLYNWVQLDLAKGMGCVHLRRYSDKSGGFWAADTLTYRNAVDGVWSFSLTRPLHMRALPAVDVGSARPPALGPHELPYRGLDYYTPEDYHIFFGRDGEADLLVSTILAHRLTLLLGVSGAGKTSLLLARVMPGLMEADPSLETVYIRKWQDPEQAIRSWIQDHSTVSGLPESGSLATLLRAAGRPRTWTLVLILDQFEEFLLLNAQERAAFIDELAELHDNQDLPVHIILSFREDRLYAVLSELERRIPDAYRSRRPLQPLTRGQAREAIVLPVKGLGMDYEPRLTEQLLDDLAVGEGATVLPPQLQLICRALYEHARAENQGQITMADYEAVGGTRGVLQRYLDAELARFAPEERQIARGALQELVTSQGTKAAKPAEALAQALGVSSALLSPILDKLVGARLVRRLDSSKSLITYELTHEYLIEKLRPDAEERARKQAQEVFWQDFQLWENGLRLNDRYRFTLANAHRDTLRLAPPEVAFMIRCAVHHDQDVDYWMHMLGVQQASTVLETIVGQQEPWVEMDDRVNALRATTYLPIELQRTILYEQALSEDERVAGEARALLAKSRADTEFEGIVAHFGALLDSENLAYRATATHVLAALDRPLATRALEEGLWQQPEETLLDLIPILIDMAECDAQRLLVEMAVFYPSPAVREQAQNCLQDAAHPGIAARLFELCVPTQSSYTTAIKASWPVDETTGVVRQGLQRIISTVRLLIMDWRQDSMFSHNRALRLVAMKGEGSTRAYPLTPPVIDAIVRVAEQELRQPPRRLERAAGWLFLVPLMALPIWLSSSYLAYCLNSLACVILPVTMLALLIVGTRRFSHVPEEKVSPWLTRLRGWTRRQDVRDFLLAQSLPLAVVLVSGMLRTLSTRGLLSALGFLASLIYLGYCAAIVFIALLPYAARNAAWFFSGPGRTKRWHTARRMLLCLPTNLLVTSLLGSARKGGDAPFPIEVTHYLYKTHLGLYQHELAPVIKEVVQNPDRYPEAWAEAARLFRKRRPELVRDIAREEMARSDSRVRAQAGRLSRLRIFRMPKAAVQLPVGLLKALLALGVCACLLFVGASLVYWVTDLAQRTHWTLLPGGTASRSLWAFGKSGLYRAESSGEGGVAPFVLVSAQEGIYNLQCDRGEGSCFALSARHGIAEWTSSGLQPWQPIRPATKEAAIFQVETMWVADAGSHPRVWVYSGWHLIFSDNGGSTWQEHPALAGLSIQSLSPVSSTSANIKAMGLVSPTVMAALGVTPTVPATRSAGIEVPITTTLRMMSSSLFTNDGGQTWAELDGILVPSAHPLLTHYDSAGGPSWPACSEGHCYTLSLPGQPSMLLGQTVDNQLVRMDERFKWQPIFVPKDHLMSTTCGAWFSEPETELDGETTLLYLSYALLNGEQGVFLTRDLGKTWVRGIVVEADRTRSKLYKIYPGCDLFWNAALDRVSRWFGLSSQAGPQE